LSVVLGYDPHGYSVPYGGFFSGNKEETFVQLCLQLLALLLQDATDTSTKAVTAWGSWRPQEEFGRTAALSSGPHVFRELLAGITSDREVDFLVTGVVTLLGTVSEERSTYLPKSMKVPPFLSELLVLVFHLVACNRFVTAACKNEDIADLVEGVLQVGAEAPEHMHDDTIALLTWGVLLRLTTHRDACVAFIEDFEGDVPDDLPEVSGSVMDLLIVAAVKQASDYFLTTRVNPIHRCIVEACLCAIANLSPFAEGLATETCFRFFALVERVCKSVQTRRTAQGGAVWLPYLLEALENIMQYQYSSNTHLAYGIMARVKLFRGIDSIVSDLGEVVSTPTPNGTGGNSPRTEVSEAGSSSPLNEERVAQWRKDVKAHLNPLIRLLEVVVPELEAAVEKKDISNPEDAKELLPKSVLGLLPAPPAFTTRTLRYCERTHRACEHCLVACLANGPIAELWDAEGQADDADGDADAEKQGKKQPKGKGEEATSGNGSKFEPPPRGKPADGAKQAAGVAAVAAAGAAAGELAESADELAESEEDMEEEEEEEEELEEEVDVEAERAS